MNNHNLEKFYPAASQPNTLTAALVDAGHYASISSAGASLPRSKKGPPETFEITLSGFRDNPETGKPEFVVCRVLVEKTPGRFLGPDAPKISRQEAEGRAAKQAGKTEQDCPYRERTIGRKLWMIGFSKGEKTEENEQQ